MRRMLCLRRVVSFFQAIVTCDFEEKYLVFLDPACFSIMQNYKSLLKKLKITY